MKNIVRNLVLAVLLSFGTAAIAQAEAQGQGPGPRDPGQRQAEFLKAEGLTDAQAAQVLDLFTKAKNDARALRAQLRVVSAQIEAGLTTSSPDTNALNALVDQRTKLLGEAQKLRISTEVQIHKLVGDKVFYELKDHFLHSWAKARFHSPGMMGPQPSNP